jgi:hypothetical protein
MTDQTLNQGGAILKGKWLKREWGASEWVKRTVAVTFCLGLVVTLGAVFTRVIAARVPEQRATLEKLITDRTGLEVRFDNVHFAWDLDGTSAVFTRVELTDPDRGRVHVLAPELRVEFDTWDFLRHHQFSLGHVTLSSPDIEIVGDPEESLMQAVAPRARRGSQAGVRADEAALVHRYLGWAGLMPSGRIEVEGARVHLRRRGERVPGHSFTLSQAVVSRSAGSFSAYGTMLLSQDLGQSLFVSAKLDGLDAGARLSGDLRFIARRVFLDKLDVPGLRGRGTIDAKLVLQDGRIASGSWEASARELLVNDGTRFDHVTVNGTLARAADDVLLDFTDLQLTRGARLERAPALHARLELEPDLKIARTTVRAERVPFMAAEFVAGLLAPQTARVFPAVPGGWVPTAGELRAVRFDSGRRRISPESWQLSAQVSRLELTRPADSATVGQLAVNVRRDARGLVLAFDAANTATLRMGAMQQPRPVQLAGSLALVPGDGAWRFDEFSAVTGPGNFSVDGEWHPGAKRAEPLRVALKQVDHALLRELWTLVAADSVVPEPWSRIEQGVIGEGSVELAPAADGAVNWGRSRGTLALSDLAASGEDAPRLAGGQGKLNFARGGAQLTLESGTVDDLVIDGVRLDWPRSGTPRLHALFEGQMESRLLRGMLKSQGLERLSGAVSLEADARGERELRRPELWRVTARVSGATVPLAGGLPPIEKLSGTIRYSAQQLRALSLQGSWLGGPVEIESRRTAATSRGLPAFSVSGLAEADPLLELLGGAEAANRVSGQLAWNGSVQPGADSGNWQVTLSSNLSGLESHLPEPFAKNRARSVPVTAELRIGADGIREFNVDGREISVHGQVRAGAVNATFKVQGVSGELRRAAGRRSDPEVKIESLDLARAPALLAASGALLPAEGELALQVDKLRYGGREFGALHASIARRGEGLDFSLDTPATALHELSARGRCETRGHCRAEFSADTVQLAALLREVQLPTEWPATSLRASGTLDWPVDSADIARALAGSFELSTQGLDAEHQLSARATLADGQILLVDVQGTGPEPDQVFRGTGRVGLVARVYDLTVDYERIALAATAVPSPARARFARAWNAMRGSAARHGWTAAPETRRVQWHGTWD